MKQPTPGMRIKYSRKKEKMKLSELADKINVPIFILKSYETDRKELPYELARHIATVLHTTAGYLLGWEADPFLAEVYDKKQTKKHCLMKILTMMNHFLMMKMTGTMKTNLSPCFMR